MAENIECARCSWLRIVLLAAVATLVGASCLAGSVNLAYADAVKKDVSSAEVAALASEDPSAIDRASSAAGESADQADASTTPKLSENSATDASQDVAEPKPGEGISTTPVVQKPEKKPTKAGWLQDTDGVWYYFARTDAKPTVGWVKSKKKWYWMQADKNGAMATDAWVTDKNKRYYVDAAGVMKTGWFKVDGHWYYANKSGAVQQSGWAKSGGKWYWLQSGEQGKMAQGTWIVDKNKRYYLTAGSGAMATKWFKVDGAWYYANKSGAQQTNGWVKSGGKWYWLLSSAEEGRMLSGATKEIKGKLYSFDGNGAMRANCQVNLGDGIARYAASSGAISRLGEYKDGEVILTNASGQILSGWQKIGGKWFYGEAGTGIAQKGWLKLGSKWYYLDSNAAMVTGTRTIDGKTHIFTGSGKWLGSDNMASKAQGYSSNTNWLILVDRGAHRVGVFNGSKGNWNRSQTFSCVTGAPGSPTITGTFKTTGAKRMSLSTDSRARWCTQISGGYFFHTILASESELGHSLSHGCIRLAVPNAQWIYHNVGRGTTVVIYN